MELKFEIDELRGKFLEQIEEQLIHEGLKKFEGNRQKTSNWIGFSVRTLRNKLRKYGIFADQYLPPRIKDGKLVNKRERPEGYYRMLKRFPLQ